MLVANNISEVIVGTPVVKVNRPADENHADIYVELEFSNPGLSAQDRIANAMIGAAEDTRDLKPGGTIIEPTSGNTGIGIAMVASAKGYRTVIVMPDTMSHERRNLLKAFGAELILTPGEKGMKGAIEKASEIAEEKSYFMPQQFDNMANPKIHEKTTGKEILEQFPDGLDAFVSGVGTGGTVSGAGKVLKEHFEDVKIYAVEPEDAPVLRGGEPGPHKIQGIGAGFIPNTLNVDIYDDVLQISNEEAFKTSREIARTEGILGGISSGAAIAAAKRVAKELGKGKKVLAILPSNGERYLSTPLYQFDEE